MKLALHRSITFWAGILVMAFILWMWRDSTQRSRWLMKAPWSLDSFGSGIALEYDTGIGVVGRSPDWAADHQEINDLPEYYPEVGKMRFGRPFFARPLDPAERMEWFSANLPSKRVIEITELVRTRKSSLPDQDPMQILYQVDFWTREGPDNWKLFCPYWILLLAFAIPWTALLLRRAGRRKRAIEKHPELAPS